MDVTNKSKTLIQKSFIVKNIEKIVKHEQNKIENKIKSKKIKNFLLVGTVINAFTMLGIE